MPGPVEARRAFQDGERVRRLISDIETRQGIALADARAVAPAAAIPPTDGCLRPARAVALELAEGAIVAIPSGRTAAAAGGPGGDYLPCERGAESALKGAGFGG